MVLRLADEPVTHPERQTGEGAIGQIMDDLEQLRALGAESVLLDPFNGDPDETCHPGDGLAGACDGGRSALGSRSVRPVGLVV